MAWSADQKRIENKKKNVDSKTRFSVWTPMSHAPTNEKVFEERREVVQKWFDKWMDPQRKKVLTDIIEKCNIGQLHLVNELVKMRLPVECKDFSRVLPRALSLYIFSFLDPRSLCRCSQVCWYWKYLTELDQLWMPKAIKLGWYLSFTPSPFEAGVWKRHYLENVRSLHYLPAGNAKGRPLKQTNGVDSPGRSESKTPDKPPVKKTMRVKSKPPKPLEHKPWRGNDPVANDIYRNNYLDNKDPVLSKRQQKTGRPTSGKGGAYIGSTGGTKGIINVKSPEEENHRPKDGRPQWAQKTKTALNISTETVGGMDATVRPAPLNKTIGGSDAVRRTTRHPPKGDLFPSREWKPMQPDSSDDES
ncbi:F-box only protein 16-like [Amphiura filiformis]|uniref:F-box only protein 16-like n=1 Tax=Amphiura filiformis TaxID=82378 RepID=UPI003B213D17